MKKTSAVRWMAKAAVLLVCLLIIGLTGSVAAEEPGEWSTVVNEDGQAVRIFRYTEDVQWVSAEVEPVAHTADPVQVPSVGVDMTTVVLIACGAALLATSGYCFYKVF